VRDTIPRARTGLQQNFIVRSWDLGSSAANMASAAAITIFRRAASAYPGSIQMSKSSSSHSVDAGRNLRRARFWRPDATPAPRQSTLMAARPKLCAALIVDDSREPAGLSVLRTAPREVGRAQTPPVELDGRPIIYRAELDMMSTVSHVA
jgi:hypothetical protein